VVLPVVERTSRNGDREYLQVTVDPLFDDGGNFLGVSISFEDISRYRYLQNELEHANQELETASEELQSTNEELETANEELQSTVEELETTNEELQSANEELETMNEELESTNEELQAINDELRQRSEDYDRVNTYLGTVLGSVRIGVVVVDSDLVIRTWNRRSEDLWGLRADEAEGQPLLGLDIGLPVSQLQPSLVECLQGNDSQEPLLLTAVNRRGREMRCRVLCTPLVDQNRPLGVVLLMEEIDS
jgi:two-component system, chemotaxis family, CheB/CheR fusion protein